MTGDTIKIGYFIPKPDPTFDALLKAAGGYDSPDSVAQSYVDYMQIYQNLFETYGRKIELVRIDGTGAAPTRSRPRPTPTRRPPRACSR